MTDPAAVTGEPRALHNRTVLVTGAGRGLGAAIARAFLQAGACVVLDYRSSRAGAEAIAETAGPERAVALQADVTDAQAVRVMVERGAEHFGRPVDTLVCNALASYSFDGDARAKAHEIGWTALQRQFEGSVLGALNCMQAVLPDMHAAGDGRIVTIGTNLFQNPVVPYHDYTAAKAALLSLTRTFAADLGPDGITVNMASGGLLRTTDASAATPPEVFDLIAASTPLRRVVTPEEFADAVLFFASPWARAVTGQNLVVDGGLVKD